MNVPLNFSNKLLFNREYNYCSFSYEALATFSQFFSKNEFGEIFKYRNKMASWLKDLGKLAVSRFIDIHFIFLCIYNLYVKHEK